MTGRLLSRLERLESRSEREDSNLKVRIVESVKPLPVDYNGERHRVTREVEDEYGRKRWVGEEVPGPKAIMACARPRRILTVLLVGPPKHHEDATA
jgi:hypothetical protein